MQGIVIALWSATFLGAAVVISVALGYWLRDVKRDTVVDGVEPSPVSARALLYTLLAGLVFIGIRLVRGEPLPFGFIGLTATFIGFGLSAGWYLMARKAIDGPSGRKVAMYSGGIAATFGALSAFTPL